MKEKTKKATRKLTAKNPRELRHQVFHQPCGNFVNAKRLETALEACLARANAWINEHAGEIDLVDTNVSVTPYTAHVVVWYLLAAGIDALDMRRPYGTEA